MTRNNNGADELLKMETAQTASLKLISEQLALVLQEQKSTNARLTKLEAKEEMQNRDSEKFWGTTWTSLESDIKKIKDTVSKLELSTTIIPIINRVVNQNSTSIETVKEKLTESDKALLRMQGRQHSLESAVSSIPTSVKDLAGELVKTKDQSMENRSEIKMIKSKFAWMAAGITIALNAIKFIAEFFAAKT